MVVRTISQANKGAVNPARLRGGGRRRCDMAAFARGPDITARLCDVIEYLQSDAVKEPAELDATVLLKELNRLLSTNQVGTDHGRLEALMRHVRAGRGEILSGDR